MTKNNKILNAIDDEVNSNGRLMRMIDNALILNGLIWREYLGWIL